MLDLMFVCLDVHNEHQCVIILYFFHGRLCGQGELDDGIVVQPKKEEMHTFDLNLYGSLTKTSLLSPTQILTCYKVHQ